MFSNHFTNPCYQPILSSLLSCYFPMLSPHMLSPHLTIHTTPFYSPTSLSHVINTFIIPCSIPMLSSNVITPCYHPMLTLHINTMYSIRVIILCCTPYYHPILSLYFIILGDLYFSLQLLPCSSRHINSTIFKKNILSILETLYSIGNTGFHVAMKRKWCYSN
jgi:hypothetical protein